MPLQRGAAMKTHHPHPALEDTPVSTPIDTRSTLKRLVGSGDRIGLLTLPILAGGIALNVAYPSLFAVGGPPATLRVLSIAVLVPGLVIWGWSVALILTKVPRGELITSGPYRLVKHPLYTGVALLVLPWAGFLLDTWLGTLVGAAVYVGSRLFAPREEAELAATFGPAWDAYLDKVRIPWL
jgi:protein-S-isoprenylcysteine O-methyltransferase Ste14